MSQKRLLIDGDVLIHMACWQKPITRPKLKALRELVDTALPFIGTEKGHYPLKAGMTREEALDALEAAQLTYQPTLRAAENRFRHFMKGIAEAHWVETDDMLFSMAIGNSTDNYRLKIHPEYKLHKARAGTNKKRAPYIQDLRMWAVDTYGAHYCEGYEADDAIRTWATKLGIGNYVVVSVDKDLNLIPGDHFDPKTEVKENQKWYVEPHEAEMFFWEQMLMGDPIDNIPGIVGIGPKKAEKILSECDTPEEAMEQTVLQYDLKYGQEGYDKLLFNGQLLHIWRWKEDHWTFDKEKYEEITGTRPSADS